MNQEGLGTGKALFQCLRVISSCFKLGVWYCPCDGDIGFAIGPSEFGFRTVWPSKNLGYLKVPREKVCG